MTKVKDSIHTYLPIIWFVFAVSIQGGLYHAFAHARPHLVLVLLLVSVLTHYSLPYTRTKGAMYLLIWRAVTLATLGVVAQNIHESMFRHVRTEKLGIVIPASLIYGFLVVFFRRVESKSVRIQILLHVIFLFFSVHKTWQINYALYIIIVLLEIYVQWRWVLNSEIQSGEIHWRPLRNAFHMLMMNDIAAVIVCFGQLIVLSQELDHPEQMAVKYIYMLMRKGVSSRGDNDDNDDNDDDDGFTTSSENEDRDIMSSALDPISEESELIIENGASNV